MKPCVDKATFERLKKAATPALIHEMLGCTWGHTIGSKDDQTPCMEPAAQIVALHPRGDDPYMTVKLCERHVEVVKTLTNPHKERA